MFLLQAALELGILLMEIGMFLVFLVLPLIWTIVTYRAISALKTREEQAGWKHYTLGVFKGFAYGCAI